MSDKPISVGDLVMVVRAAKCGCNEALGRPFIVQEIATDASGNCVGCGMFAKNICAALQPNGLWIDMWRLKRFDPDASRDDVPTIEELLA